MGLLDEEILAWHRERWPMDNPRAAGLELVEEWGEFVEALSAGSAPERFAELGDVMIVATTIAGRLGHDLPEPRLWLFPPRTPLEVAGFLALGRLAGEIKREDGTGRATTESTIEALAEFLYAVHRTAGYYNLDPVPARAARWDGLRWRDQPHVEGAR